MGSKKNKILLSSEKAIFYGKIEFAVADLVGLDIKNVRIGWKLQILWHFENFNIC